MKPSGRRALIMAGGTGGHIFPGLAVGEGLRAAGWDVAWMGAPGGMESRLVPPQGYRMCWVDFGGVRGKGAARWLRLPAQMLRALAQAARALRSEHPGVVLGMGGYITVPGGLLARVFGARLVLHEQNAVAGLSNRLLARLAARALCAFPGALPGAEWVGNPVRRAIRDLAEPALRYAQRSGRLQLLVVGGSLGARALNEMLPRALALIEPQQRPRVVHQSGRAHLQALREAYAAAGVDADCREFIDDMAGAYAQADLVVCRAGASTVTEVACAGVAALFVPFPFAVDDHQTANARYLADGGAAMLVQQADLDAQGLAARLRGLRRDELQAMACKARALARSDAVERIVAVCEALGSQT
jgi:UDP-N-acetylglucosamine--N-acetylmuramyl-(pentapeptide) pyrophosphoryl-undecaprenol N-acetylglucosamine transferase